VLIINTAVAATVVRSRLLLADFCLSPLSAIGCGFNRVTALPLQEHFDSSELGVITRRNAVLSTAAQCLKDCLLMEIKRRARSAAVADRALCDGLALLF